MKIIDFILKNNLIWCPFIYQLIPSVFVARPVEILVLVIVNEEMNGKFSVEYLRN